MTSAEVSAHPRPKIAWLGWLVRAGAAATVIIVIVIASTATLGCRPGAPSVVLYCAQDQELAEPVLSRFTQQTGIRVRAVYDSEAVKTVGLANRLVAESGHPVCDVFWSNEELRTRLLASKGIFDTNTPWAAFGRRTRRLVVPEVTAPTPASVTRPAPTASSLVGLTNAEWRGQVSLAFPLFGTTATHLLVLRHHWGESNWAAWCRGLVANQPFIEDGNSHVVQRVARGEARVGLTDSDDIELARRNGRKVAAGAPFPEMLAIPNTVAVIRGAPHPEAAQALFQFLQGPEVRRSLVEAGAIEPDSNETNPPTLHPSWDEIVRDIDVGTAQLKELFRR